MISSCEALRRIPAWAWWLAGAAVVLVFGPWILWAYGRYLAWIFGAAMVERMMPRVD